MSWVSQLYSYLHQDMDRVVARENVDAFLKHLSVSREDWQVRQAREAIRLYRYMQKRNLQPAKSPASRLDAEWRVAADQMTKVLRLKKRVLTTERSYLGWVQDIDFEQGTVTVRAGKGDKDRVAILLESLKDDLRLHLDSVRHRFNKDRADGVDGVCLPGALERKYPQAGKEWS